MITFIKINGEEYDPYYVLDSTPDDTDEHINKMFKKKIKIFHPDKIKNVDKEKRKKYDLYMQILMESYEWIKKKRDVTSAKRRGDSTKHNYKQFDEDELKRLFNKIEVEDNTNRFKSIKDYESFIPTIKNIFKDKKFTNEQFNDIFEYFKENYKSKNDDDKSNKKSTDGFYCYDNNGNGNYATISSYNGLLISSDIALGEGNILQTQENDNDNYYKNVYNSPTNPNELPNIKNIKKNKNVLLKNDEITNKISEHRNEIRNVHKYTNYVNENEKLHNKIYEDLLEKEDYDKYIIEKYAKNVYDEDLVEMAKNGELESSPTFLSKLKEHHKLIREN